MTEPQVGLLVKSASLMTGLKNNTTQNVLTSYYLMRCRELTKGYGLPKKHFSSKIRCPHCFLEWNQSADVKVRPIILSKKQRWKVRNSKNYNDKDYSQSRKDLLRRNEIEQMCTFCNKVTTTTSLKPEKVEIYRVTPSPLKDQSLLEKKKLNKTLKNVKENTYSKTRTKVKKNEIKVNQTESKNIEVNIYSKTKDVFSLANDNNTLQKLVKEQRKIKNNKKKKDKFAGLCRQAVLASAKFKEEKAVLASAKVKEEKKKPNKLDLFLKPSLT